MDFAPPRSIEWHGEGHGIVRFDDPARLVVYFYTKAVHQPVKSRQEGRPVFDNVPYVTMHPPGERLNIVDRPANENDRLRFPAQWQKYLMNQTQIPDGTLIDLLFPNNPARADLLKGQGIHTVEQLANLSAQAIDTVGMGAQELVNIAKRYLDNASSGTAFLKMQKELEDKDQRIRMLENQAVAQNEQINALINQIRNPNFGQMQPAFDPNHDAQASRINANHKTVDLAKDKAVKTKADLFGTKNATN